MQQSSNPSHVATAGLLLETSLGSLTIDILGADCPALSGNFLNLCRAEFWNGAVATEVIPEVAVFFSLAADRVYYDLLRKALAHRRSTPASVEAPQQTTEKLLVQSFWSLLPRHEPQAIPSSMATSRRLLPATDSNSFYDGKDVVDQQDRAFQQAVEQEVRLCKRRRCVGLSANSPSSSCISSNSGSTAQAGVFQPVFHAAASHGGGSGAAASPCTVGRAGSLIIDVTAPTLRFGLTLSNRTMDFLDKQYMVVGYVAEGECVLRRMQRAPYRDRAPDTHSSILQNTAIAQDDIVAGRPASVWPQPVRLLRIKRAIVLPTAGAEKYVAFPDGSWVGLSGFHGGMDGSAEARQQRQRVGQALQQAGCFAWWASAAAVRAAHQQLVQIVRACVTQEQYTPAARPSTIAEAEAYLQRDSASTPVTSTHGHTQKPFIIIQQRATRPSKGTAQSNHDEAADALSLTYNSHYTGDYLSSEDEDDVYDSGSIVDRTGVDTTSASQTLQLSARQLEERRKIFMQQHQEKANETLSLMLNVLNGVADIRGDIKPPENVLFVCKLNPVTTGDGLAICFAQFGRVVSADVIYDTKTKQSLCYGFVEFETVEACFRAFQKMDQALIDDCRIHVDFSQSVSKLWAQRQREMRKRDRPS